ncbi:ABC transporter permease [Nocardiopsis suaedae]|uniref:FtsX-like permease family protein n=1 Tax=Nocardiopsis suaedae TaxID=3018444 RepID=A0ABT4TKE2_9ACTN|nr:FtsX-like permease family protein [Nocardiopsis suaedae]MDA2804724.1 FtsX-like permease family protein [Nocardiopsis suaedae]
MIAFAMVRHRLRAVVGGFIALTLGVALLAASAVVIASSLPAVPQRYGGADVMAVPEAAGTRSDGATVARAVWSGAEADALAGEIAAADGVEAAVAERRFDARVMDGERIVGGPADGAPVAAGWSSFPLGAARMLDGGAPSERDQVVLPASYGRSVGDRVTVLTAGAAWPMTVSGVTDGEDVLVADALAAESATGVSLIGAVAEPGADAAAVGGRVRDVLDPGAEVFTAADQAAMAAEFDATDDWVGQQLLVLVGALAVFVSVFVVGTTFTFQVAVRRREIALLRAVGATPGQVRRMLLGEAALVGAAASAAGSVLGVAGAFLLGDWMVGRELLSGTWEVRSVAVPVAAAVLTGMATALAGVLGASRRAAGVAPLEALRPGETRSEPLPRWRLWAAAAAAATAAATGAATAAATARADAEDAMGLALGASLALLVAAAVAAPVHLPRILGLLPGRSPMAELLRAEARAGARRLGAVMMPSLLISALAVTVLGLTGTVGAAIDEHSRGEIPGAAMVMSGDEEGLTDRALDLAGEHAEGEVFSQLSTGVYAGGRWVESVGLHRYAPEEGTVQASPETAERFGWRDGDTVELTWADGTEGTVPVTVAPFPPALELWAELALPYDLAREHDPGAFTAAASLDPAEPDGLPGTLSGALAGQGAYVQDTARVIDDGIAGELRLMRLFTWVILALSLGYAAVSLGNTLSLAASARRRDLALLRVAGAHRWQAAALLTAESGLASAVGLSVGALLSLPGLFALGIGLRDEFDPRKGPVEVSVHLPWAEFGAVAAACLAVGLLAALVSASRALRRTPSSVVAERG